MKILYTLGLITLLTGCHYFQIKFKHTDPIPGMDTHISKKGTSIQYCVITHGIGRKEYDYSYDLIEQVSKDLLGRKFQHSRVTCDVDTLRERNHLEKHICTSLDNKNKIIFYSVRWSVFTDSIKDAFIHRENHYPGNWTFSKQIKKGIMIERAGDLFFVQRNDILKKVFAVYDKVFEDIDASSEPDAPLSIVTASLGSQVFLRYLNHSVVTDKTHQSFTVKRLNLVKEDVQEDKDELQENEEGTYLDKNIEWYLFSNQMNLMLEGVYRWGGDLDTNLNLQSINMTVFRNPNDMLCYVLPNDTPLLDSTATHIQNVPYFNGPCRNGLIKTHTKTLYLKKMHRALAYGDTNVIDDKRNWWFKHICCENK